MSFCISEKHFRMLSYGRVGVFAQLCPTACDSMDEARRALLSMGFPRQYQSGLPFPSPGDLPDPGIKPESTALAGRFFTTEPPRKPTFITFNLFSCYE